MPQINGLFVTQHHTWSFLTEPLTKATGARSGTSHSDHCILASMLEADLQHWTWTMAGPLPCMVQ